jgi:hypothetical protein
MYDGTGHVSTLALTQALSIYKSNDRETPEMIVQAFKFGTFSKIPEFIDFRARLSQSLQKTVTKSILAVNQVFYTCQTWEQVSGVLASFVDSEILSITSEAALVKLFDNRDVKVIPEWTGSKTSLAEKIRSSPFPYAPAATAERLTLLRALKAWDSNKLENLVEIATYSSQPSGSLETTLKAASHGTRVLTMLLQGEALDMAHFNSFLESLQCKPRICYILFSTMSH